MEPDLLRGHLDGVILSILEAGPAHGYALIDAIRQRTDGALHLPTGTLYPALARLERGDLIAGEWTIVDGRRRRTYQLTARGRRSLETERDHWGVFVDTISSLLSPLGGEELGYSGE